MFNKWDIIPISISIWALFCSYLHVFPPNLFLIVKVCYTHSKKKKRWSLYISIFFPYFSREVLKLLDYCINLLAAWYPIRWMKHIFSGISWSVWFSESNEGVRQKKSSFKNMKCSHLDCVSMRREFRLFLGSLFYAPLVKSCSRLARGQVWWFRPGSSTSTLPAFQAR